MHTHAHSKETLSMPAQSARQKEAAYVTTPIRDSIQELLVTVRRNQIFGAATKVFAE